MDDQDRRVFTAPITLDRESRSANGELRLSGYASVFDEQSEDLGFFEIIRRGAFKDALRKGDQVLLWMHDSSLPLARRSAGSLVLEEDDEGLRFSATLPPTTLARDAIELVRAGVVRSMSFAFSMGSGVDRWTSRGSEKVREILKIGALHEVSLVGEPAYAGTSVAARARSTTQSRGRLQVRERSPYGVGSDFSWFRDLKVVAEASQRWSEGFAKGLGPTLGAISEAPSAALPHVVHGDASTARQRLAAAGDEIRDIDTTSGFSPSGAPAFIADSFAIAARSRAALAPLLGAQPLPPFGQEVDLVELTSGAETGVQESEGDAVAENDIVEATRSAPVTTISGFLDASQQLYDRAAGGKFDLYAAAELGSAYAENLDAELISGTGTDGRTWGLIEAATTSTTYTATTPTPAAFWRAVLETIADVASLLGAPPTHLLAHPRRIAWLASWMDSTGAAVSPELPFGIPIVSVSAIPVNLGASTNEDVIIVAALAELPLFIDAPTIAVLPELGSVTLTTRIRVHGYTAFAATRRGAAIGVLSGSGLASPSFGA